MEMMGLIMVVILLIFGLLIYVRIQISSAEKELENVDDTFMVDMSSKVLKVMLHTTSSCSNLDGRQLISDLASNSRDVNGYCTYTNLIKCNGATITSEHVLFGNSGRPNYLDGNSGFVQNILEKSLKEEALLNYTLKIQMKDGCVIYETLPIYDECKDAKASYQGQFIFDSDKGKVEATLTVC